MRIIGKVPPKMRSEFLKELADIHGIENPEEYLKTLDSIRENVHSSDELSFLEGIGSILGNSERFDLLYCLGDKPHSVGDLKNQIKKAQSTVSHHLKKIEKAGLIQPWKTGKFTNFSLIKGKFDEINSRLNVWLEDLSFWFGLLPEKIAS